MRGCRSSFPGSDFACEAKANLHPLALYTIEVTPPSDAWVRSQIFLVLDFGTHAAVCYRARSSWCWIVVRRPDPGLVDSFPGSFERNGTADSVAAQLCHRGQGVLRLSCAG